MADSQKFHLPCVGVGLKANCFNTELFENSLKYAAGKFCTAEFILQNGNAISQFKFYI